MSGRPLAGEVVLVTGGNGGITTMLVGAGLDQHLVGYKAPRHIVRADSVGRAPNSKADYPAAQALAAERVALDRSSR